MTRDIIYNAFTHVTLSHQSHGQWRRPEASDQRNFSKLEPWVRLAQTAERGKLDAIFFADTVGVYDTYEGSRNASVREGMQFPSNDPASLISALGYVTEHLGFIVTSSIIQEHPFSFARKFSTLDHLTNGRIGWNIVTSYLQNAARNFGYSELERHDDRYQWAEEYTEVAYKLWEASWEDDAVVADTSQGRYAAPEKVHAIHHQGKRYRVEGPHLPQPSPQRTPILAQAGTSGAGREFAARHAELTFLPAFTPESAQRDIAAINHLLPQYGRRRGDLKFLTMIHPVIGSTEAEARVKHEEFLHWRSEPAYLAHLSGSIGFDLSSIDPDTPLKDIKTDAIQGNILAAIDAEPDKTARFGDVIRRRLNKAFAGTPERIADEIERWTNAGIDGFNLVPVVTPDWFATFVDEVAPVLRQRGLMKSEYRPGTLREKIFGGASFLPDRHIARSFRSTGADLI
ncbi:LLM class flavin-dependent oxidoreductase [Herbaspirillum sp. RV1423]|uniref:LLM class flavin-dependent oxidoreductase n=1 Tax=Herbaspirillum sp. RV1423 TaxID=1443993 RepID=UPI0004BB28CB|nr:LLM class flavin-dependent oxidoreductase [Herbaspirillum sp. RV1423]